MRIAWVIQIIAASIAMIMCVAHGDAYLSLANGILLVLGILMLSSIK